MSVTVRWAPTPEGKSFAHGTSTPLAQLGEIFGEPIQLSESDLPILRAMAQVAELYAPFYREVIEVVEKAGSIRIWGSW